VFFGRTIVYGTNKAKSQISALVFLLGGHYIRHIMRNKLKITFWALMTMFLIVLAEFFVPIVNNLFEGSILFLLPMIIFSLLGGLLLFYSVRLKEKGRCRKFLLLTGASAFGFFVFVFLHNAFYALTVVSENIIVLKYFFEFLHAIFFLVAIPICPLGFLVGAIGSIVLFAKEKRGLEH